MADTRRKMYRYNNMTLINLLVGTASAVLLFRRTIVSHVVVVAAAAENAALVKPG